MNEEYDNVDVKDQISTLDREISLLKQKKKAANDEMRKWQTITHPERDSNIQRYSNIIADCEAKITEYERDKRALNATLKHEENELVNDALSRVRSNWIDVTPSAAYIISDQEFIHIEDYSNVRYDQNIQVRRYSPQEFIEYLANRLKIPAWKLPIYRIKQLYNECNRTFDLMRYSITPHKWTRQKTYLPIEHMEPYFINNFNLNNEDLDSIGGDADSYNIFFDILMDSLSGGKQENREHLERWIVHKVVNYRKAVTTPELVIVGHVGGNGKGILQGIMRLMFPAALSGKANSKTLNGNFNAIMIGKLIVFFDDQNTKEIPLEVVKQLAGSDTMIYEPKGKDQYEGEKTHSSAWFSNKLPFPLTPAGHEGGVDRRFSIMRTNITFLERIVREWSNEQEQISIEAAKDIAETAVTRVLFNRIEIARWFQNLRRRYPDIDEHYVLKPLHGEDYRYFLERQEDSYEVIFRDLIAPVIRSGGCVPVFVVKELLRHMDDRDYGNVAITSRMRDLAAQYKLEIETERVSIGIVPNKMRGSTKQCTVFRPKVNKQWTIKEFDWSLVSNQPYCNPGPGQHLLNEDNIVFGSSAVVEDDEE